MENPKTLQQILNQSVADVESELDIYLEFQPLTLFQGIVSSKA